MNYSPVFIELRDAIDAYIDESSKTRYRLTLEEEIALDRYIRILENHLRNLQEYEIKKEEK